MGQIELDACTPQPIRFEDFNPHAEVPYGCTVEHLYRAMQDFLDFLGFINLQLHQRYLPRLESLLMPANFSGLVGELIIAALPKYCPTLSKNQYHNGHPDLIPTGRFPNNAILHTDEGIEIKASRYPSGWQGHNPENVWLMVFVFDSNRPNDIYKGIPPKPFAFRSVVGARLDQADWSFSGRSTTSRRTITASVTASGYEKMMANWIYKASDSQIQIKG